MLEIRQERIKKVLNWKRCICRVEKWTNKDENIIQYSLCLHIQFFCVSQPRSFLAGICRTYVFAYRFRLCLLDGFSYACRWIFIMYLHVNQFSIWLSGKKQKQKKNCCLKGTKHFFFFFFLKICGINKSVNRCSIIFGLPDGGMSSDQYDSDCA